MPLDPKGRELKLGDKVIVPFRIRGIRNDELVLEPEIENENRSDAVKVRVDSSQVYRLNPGDEVYTGIPPTDGDNDEDDTGTNIPPTGPDPGGD